MDEQEKHQSLQQETPGQVSMVVIAPAWLQEAISVLLCAVSSISVLAITTDIQTALAAEYTHSPGLVLLYGHEPLQSVCDDIASIKTAWPQTCCIVMVDHRSDTEPVQSAGADQAVIKGISPGQLVQVIQAATKELDIDENQNRAGSI